MPQSLHSCQRSSLPVLCSCQWCRRCGRRPGVRCSRRILIMLSVCAALADVLKGTIRASAWSPRSRGVSMLPTTAQGRHLLAPPGRVDAADCARRPPPAPIRGDCPGRPSTSGTPAARTAEDDGVDREARPRRGRAGGPAPARTCPGAGCRARVGPSIGSSLCSEDAIAPRRKAVLSPVNRSRHAPRTERPIGTTPSRSAHRRQRDHRRPPSDDVPTCEG